MTATITRWEQIPDIGKNADLVKEIAKGCAERMHDLFIERYESCFGAEVPVDDGVYVYTYYDFNGEAIYHGFTTNAISRAAAHKSKAPWASWVQSVRYRRVRSPQVGRRLERRLQVMIPSACGGGISRTDLSYHGEIWPDELLIDHVRGTCRQSGGTCDYSKWDLL